MPEDKATETSPAGGSKFWHAVKNMGGSGFGKGALITAGLAFVGAAIGFSVLAATGSLHLVSYAFPPVPASIGKAIEIGMNVALRALLHPLGWAALAVGGAIGAGVSVRNEQYRLEEDERLSRALERAAAKECPPPLPQAELQTQMQPKLNIRPEPQAQPSIPQNVNIKQASPPAPPLEAERKSKPDTGFCCCELKRRASAQAAQAMGRECKA